MLQGREVYIHKGLRTAIGIVGGQYKEVRPEHLGAQLLEAFPTDGLDSILCGNAVGTGGNIGRLMALYSKVPQSVPVTTIDMQCASAGASIYMGSAMIASRMAHYVIAGGMESSSLQPLRTYAEGDDRQGIYKVAQFYPTQEDHLTMIRSAERVAHELGITREELDLWALRSHRLATKHRSNLTCIMNPELPDESIRPRMSEKLLRRMPTLLGPHTVTTAGNTCFTHDGAAFVSLSSEKGPYRVVHAVLYGGDPARSPLGAYQASEKVLKEARLTMDDMDAIEWNEAFAVIDVIFGKYYPHLVERYNAWGGALAYGHPYGASGAIIMNHLMDRLRHERGRYGLMAIAGAGGTGMAAIIEYLG